ncbi:MAG: type VI secretion system tip protein VgrG [Deltaproteobacteria bacterium]|nr:type VI secretion system tip protein VgrG [Deltaproteobacteria bacterium]
MSAADPMLVLLAYELDDSQLEVRHARIEERLGALFSVRAEVVLHRDTPLSREEIDAAIGTPLVLAFVRGDDASDPWHGMLVEVRSRPGPDPQVHSYSFTLAPRATRLAMTRRSRIFCGRSVPEIVTSVFADAGMEIDAHYQLSLARSYSSRELVVQYEETDLAFVSRLLEHAGMTFFFEHAEAGERLVVVDHPAAWPSLEGVVRFDPRQGTTGRRIHAMERVRRLLPEYVVVRDYHPSSPGAVLQKGTPVDTGGAGLVAVFGDHLVDAAGAKRLADDRAEELRLDRHRISAHANEPALRPGTRFTLAYDRGIARDDLDEKELVVVSATHTIVQPAPGDVAFSSELSMLPAALPYRPPRETPVPRIPGVVVGRVTGGPPSTAAPIDSEGRYRVVLPFDTEGSATSWIRRAQPYTGDRYGTHHPLHVGAEVLVAFHHGDPDRPVIVGAVPNAATIPPAVIDNATQSVTRTHNAIEMEWEDDA